MNKKILFVIPTLGSGGAERVISLLSNELADRDYRVCVLMLSNLKCCYSLNSAVNIKCLNCDDDMKYSTSKRVWMRLKKIREATMEFAPDVVISFMAETNIDVCLALMGTNIPIIVSERNDPAIDPASKIKQIIRKLAYLKPKGFVFQTPDAKGYFSKRIQKKSKIILNPLTSVLPVPYTGERDKRIVAVGRLNKQKNFPLLIDSFSTFHESHKDYSLEIYGEGMLYDDLKAYIQTKNLEERVILKGFCKDVHEKIRSASMFVMSSDFEGMPNALLEAMAIGLPCISIDCPCGGPRMLIDSKHNGILVPVNDQIALSEGMKYIAENPDEGKRMAAEAVKIREAADTKKVTDSWISFINNCLGE